MGLSSSTTKTSTKPVYSAQLEGAANNVNSAYGAQAPKISAISDQLGGLVPGLLEKYKAGGDADLQAATGYNTDVLNGKYLNGNPYLDQIVAQTNDGTRNGLAASLGTRGLTGGSAFADIISRGLAQNESNLRYTDYGNERTRMGQAASQAPSLSAAGELPLQSILSILGAQTAPVQAAAGAGSAVGGLLGQYTNGTQTQSMGLGQLIASLGGSALGGWATNGFKL